VLNDPQLGGGPQLADHWRTALLVKSLEILGGAAEQTVDHVVHQCLIHRPPHELHGLTDIDDETTGCLLNTCSEI